MEREHNTPLHTYCSNKKEYNPSIMRLYTNIYWGVPYNVGTRESVSDQNWGTILMRN